jgi:flagellar hook assembly protein FlgD
MLQWDMPQMSDFSHFNIYWSTNGGSTFAKLDSTIGVQYFLTVPNGFYEFYVTTVDQLGHESLPSNIVQTNVVIGIPEQDKGNDITMIKMGPNPFVNQITVDFKVLKETHLSIQIFDINGEPVNELYDSEIGEGQHQLKWNGTNTSGNLVPPGIYVVRFNTTNGSPITFKLVTTR